MYTFEEREKAIKLYIKYNFKESIVRRELGYPSRKMIKRWYSEYKKLGYIAKNHSRAEKYKLELKQKAIEYYLSHGKSISGTIKALGFPSRPTLRCWLKEFCPDDRKIFISKGYIEHSIKEKTEAVINLCSRNTSALDIAEKHQTSKTSLYKWKSTLLPKGESQSETMTNKNDNPDLIFKITNLEKEIKKLQLERDVLEKANEILKKELGINQEELTTKEKAELIDVLKKDYSLNELLTLLKIPKSTYFYNSKRAKASDKYKCLRIKIKEIFSKNDNRYGYRRIYIALLKLGIRVSEKVIRRLMAEENLIVVSKRNRKYSSYQGEISPSVENIINRDFTSNAPNKKWLTDITEFKIPAGKVYLSPIIDCFDGMIVSWSIGTSPNSELVTSMLEHAIETLKPDEKPIVHSDRGAHYRWDEWINRMNDAELTRSMSKKGCSPDNAACEGFFGRVKNEMFYHRSWLDISIKDFIDRLDNYLHWYNEDRVKNSLGIFSIVENRKNLGYF